MPDVPRLGVRRGGGMADVARLGVGRAEGIENVVLFGVGRDGRMVEAGRLGVRWGGGMGYVPHVCRSNLRILMRCPSLLDHTSSEGSP